MKFTATPPTKPGWYLWKLRENDIPNPCWVTTDGETYWREGKYPATNGQWCRLIPAEEVEKAYMEGVDRVSIREAISYVNEFWNTSRAKKVMEGEI